MKRSLGLGMVLILALVLGGAADDEVRAFTGEIADSQCALNVHSLTRSHQEMLKSKSMGGTSASCALYCIKYLGGDFVLSSKKDVYRLDDQEQPRNFVGQRVKITGTLAPKSDMIHVIKIEIEPESSRRPPHD
jgi:hypothetical protein